MTKTAQVAKEMKDYRIGVLGISESRWKEMHASTRMDTSGSKGKGEAKDHAENNHREREEQSRVDELEQDQDGSTGQGRLGLKCDGLYAPPGTKRRDDEMICTFLFDSCEIYCFPLKCTCCSSILSFGTIFSELVQNILNWYKIF